MTPAPLRLWWDTPLCRKWEFTERSAHAINQVIILRGKRVIPANDRDHIKW